MLFESHYLRVCPLKQVLLLFKYQIHCLLQIFSIFNAVKYCGQYKYIIENL